MADVQAVTGQPLVRTRQPAGVPVAGWALRVLHAHRTLPAALDAERPPLTLRDALR